jgi:hypothetical protein
MQGVPPALLLVLSALLVAAPTQAGTYLRITTLADGPLRLQGIEARLDYSEPPALPRLRLRIADARLAGLALAGLDWRCQWERLPVPRCAGTLRVGQRHAGELAIALDAGLRLRWDDAAASRGGELGIQDGELQAALRALPLDWLQPWLAEAMPALRITAGTLSGALRRRADGALDGDLAVAELGLDSARGDLAAAGVSAALALTQPAAPATALALDARVAGGEVLVGPLYAELATDSRLALTLAMQGAPSLQGPLRWSDPEGLSLALTAAPGGSLHLDLAVSDLARSSRRYLAGPLAAAGLAATELEGAAQLALSLADEGPASLSLSLDRVGLRQAAKGLRLAGGVGSLHWDAGGLRRDSELAWEALALYDLEFGPARLALRSEDGRLHLRAPLELRPLDGRLRLAEGWIDPRRREAELVAEVEALSLAALSARAGWPPFSGQIGGQLPRARYRAQRLEVDGGLSIDVFGGRVELDALVLERPLGVAPTLAADVRIEDLDLTPLTEAFGFGAISGRLDGRVDGLRLVDWSPVAFDAVLQTDPDYRGPRRISQRAVQDIGRVGGGLASGLQGPLLAVFDSFGYRRIGLRCRLENNVCRMGGVADSGTGYVLIEGAGLPWVTVNGFQRRVDWPVLLARLRAATEVGVKVD